jgi:PAS domain S-box-containing protein
VSPESTIPVSANEIAELRARLHDAEETLRAIRCGEVDALLIADAEGEKVYTLRGADAPYRALVEQMQEGAVTLSIEGDVIYSNHSFARLVGAPLEQVIGSSIAEFVEPGDLVVLKMVLVEGSGAIRTKLLTRNGAPLEVHISVSHVTLDEIEHRTLIVTDLSTLTKVQKESQSKDEFLAMLAHELRNPLAPIRTGLQVLKLSPNAETADRAREMMDRQLTQMIRLIDDLLDVSRVSRGKIDLKREIIDLKSVIGLAVETSLPLIEAGRHRLDVRLPKESLPVNGDPTRLSQVFSNLLNNAAKYTPDEGHIDLRAERRDGRVEVRVTDDGVGIPKEMLPEVFEMFSQVGRNLDRAQGGLGIGLTLVKRLIEMHGGSVRAESGGSGPGSVFVVLLPLHHVAPGEAVKEKRMDRSGNKPSNEKLRVLVVDDNLDGAQMLSMLVAMHGHTTQIAQTGPDALDKLAAFDAHVVFLDIGLPGLNGYEVAQRIRSKETLRGEERVVLIALTGWGSEEDKRRSREAGFDMHLTKPVDALRVEGLLNGLRS